MLNEFSRTEMLIGKAALEKLARSRVAVFGIGGVGSFVVEGLARAGVGGFVLVDDDCVSLTNINRQIHATRKTLGKPKVEVMRDRVLDINPRAEVILHKTFYMPENARELVRTDYSYIVDAVDTVTAKIDLVVSAKRLGIPVISSMGAGNKLDPTKFEIADLYETSICPLARVMRRELRKRGVKDLKVVYSKEEPLKPLETEDAGCETILLSESAADGPEVVRRQVPGSISFVPSVAGLLIAAEVVKDLLSKQT
ncbi:tRNA threonylcarbamoyladenosine dehydratase [Pelotomaculum propionicicum]|uniref:tRNA threonylcarbamoyladenosine dehydratase n=1 Tax=Pelotomaculum propionicicum TaxID=258475 RepID=UPI003B7CAA56